MKKNNLTKVLSFILNSLIIIFVTIGTIIISKRDGWAAFKWYTVLSNIFCAFSCIVFLIYNIKNCITQKNIPDWVYKLRYAATCAVTLTFIVVVAVLAPQRGPGGHKEMMLENFGLYLHTLAPLCSILCFFLVEKVEIGLKETFISIFPTLFYALICIVLNCMEILSGPYFFLNVAKLGGTKICMWIAILSIAAYLINILLYFAHKLVTKNK